MKENPLLLLLWVVSDRKIEYDTFKEYNKVNRAKTYCSKVYYKIIDRK